MVTRIILFSVILSLSWSTSSNYAAEPKRKWVFRVDTEVNGTRGSEVDGKPEKFSVRILLKNKAIDGLNSVGILSPLAFTLPPFSPTPDETAFIHECAGDLKFMEKHQKEYGELSKKLYDQAFKPPAPFSKHLKNAFDFKYRMKIQILSKVNIVHQAFIHEVTIANLPHYISWFFSKMVPSAKDNPYLSFAKEGEGKDEHIILPLLIYGTVIRKGTQPPYEISFDPRDTIITAGAQNEANDTTLYQLRSGIFNVANHPKADIGIHRVIGCTKVLESLQ